MFLKARVGKSLILYVLLLGIGYDIGTRNVRRIHNFSKLTTFTRKPGDRQNWNDHHWYHNTKVFKALKWSFFWNDSKIYKHFTHINLTKHSEELLWSPEDFCITTICPLVIIWFYSLNVEKKKWKMDIYFVGITCSKIIRFLTSFI